MNKLGNTRPPCFIPSCVGYTVHFNTFQVISGRCLLVAEVMITTLWCCLTKISHRRHSCMISHLITLFWKWVNQFLHLATLYMSNIYFKYVVWVGRESNPTRSDCSTYHCAIGASHNILIILFQCWAVVTCLIWL